MVRGGVRTSRGGAVTQIRLENSLNINRNTIGEAIEDLVQEKLLIESAITGLQALEQLYGSGRRIVPQDAPLLLKTDPLPPPSRGNSGAAESAPGPEGSQAGESEARPPSQRQRRKVLRETPWEYGMGHQRRMQPMPPGISGQAPARKVRNATQAAQHKIRSS